VRLIRILPVVRFTLLARLRAVRAFLCGFAITSANKSKGAPVHGTERHPPTTDGLRDNRSVDLSIPQDTALDEIRRFQADWADDLELLRQNRLFDESALLTFLKERGVPVAGVIVGEPSDLHKRGWLTGDGANEDGKPMYHPFRLFVVHQILEACKLRVATAASLRRDTILALVQHVVEGLPPLEEIGNRSATWNRIVDLAILAEPVYWPNLISRVSMGAGLSFEGHLAKVDEYRGKLLALVRTLDPQVWEEHHKNLRTTAAWMDGNTYLYVMLRVASWEQRQELKGAIGAALWIRHIAEMIRRAFEEALNTHWLEEDQAFGHWHTGARAKRFGADRPFDDILRAKPYVAYNFGLFTGSAIRWYLEGETEFFAVCAILSEADRFAVELVNLHGGIGTGKNNVPLKLESMLREDLAFRRFSMISVDGDSEPALKAIRRQVAQDNIVGSINVHRPDFEFANFTVGELAEVAAQIDEANGVSGDGVRLANWTGIGSGSAFEENYRRNSKRPRSSLKGEEWGRALGEFAMKNPNRADNGIERPIRRQVWSAFHGWQSNYDYQRERFTFDSKTLEQIERPPVVQVAPSDCP
jgi:hypothetical protein